MMKNNNHGLFRSAALILLLSVSLFGCGDNKLPDDGTLFVSVGGESEDGYDPTMGWGRYGNPLFQSTLFKKDNQLNIVNDLALSRTISPDGLSWTVKIRTDVRFSDGTALKAEDVVYTFMAAKESGGKVDLTYMDKAQKTGDDEITFFLKRPSSTFIIKLISLGIVPSHIHNETYARNPVGSGPYKMVSWQEGQQLIVEANPYYYGETPAIKRIVFLFSEEDARVAALNAGKVHIAAVPQAFAAREFKGYTLHPVKSVDNRGIMLPFIPDTGTKTAAGYPIGNNVTADPAIRKAIEYCIDKKLLAEKILNGFGSPAYGIADNLPWDNPDGRLDSPDPEKASAILETADWIDRDNDGIREKNGIKAEFRLIYPASDSIRQSLAVAAADMIGKSGIHVMVEGKSWDEIETLMHSCAVLFGWGSLDPTEMYNVYHSKFSGSGWYNTGFYKNETVDMYMDKALTAVSWKKSLEFWKLAQWDGSTGLSSRGDSPWVWLVNLDHTYFVSDQLDIGVSRMEPHGHGWPVTANICEWKWKE